MDPKADQGPGKRLNAWKAPTLRKLGHLDNDELANVQAAADPIALLFEMKPELRPRG